MKLTNTPLQVGRRVNLPLTVCVHVVVKPARTSLHPRGYPPIPFLTTPFLSAPVQLKNQDAESAVLAFVDPAHAEAFLQEGADVQPVLLADALYSACIMSMPLCVLCGGVSALHGDRQASYDAYFAWPK